MVSFKEATKPVSLVDPDKSQLEVFERCISFYNNKKFNKASDLFLKLSESYDGKNTQSRANQNAMNSNSYKMLALRVKEQPVEAQGLLIDTLQSLNKSLEAEPYFAEYLTSKEKIMTYLHQTYGCEATFDGELWEITCYKLSKALGLFGVSPGFTEQLECSICGKDPIICEHIPGEIYNGRLAIHVAKNIVCDHVAIVDTPMQKETYISPRPLSAQKLREILPRKPAEDIISGKKVLTCKVLLHAIQENGLHGIEWSK